jgi:hypothetical protein
MSIDREATLAPENDAFSISTALLADRPAQATSTVIQSGWDAAEKTIAPVGDYPTEFKFVENSYQIIRFMDPPTPPAGPFAIYKQHFLNQKTTGKRSYVCLEKSCPLCVRLQNKAEDKKAFTVINYSAEGGPQRQILVASVKLYKQLAGIQHSTSGPLINKYWSVTRTGKQQTTNYIITPIKPRDLLEDAPHLGLDEAAAEEVFHQFQAYDRSAIKESTWDELEAVALSLM